MNGLSCATGADFGFLGVAVGVDPELAMCAVVVDGLSLHATIQLVVARATGMTVPDVMQTISPRSAPVISR